MSSAATIALERALEARAAITAALELTDPRDQPHEELAAAREALDTAVQTLEDDAPYEERAESPWRRSAAAWHTPPELVRALEVVLRNAGAMAAHPSGAAKIRELELGEHLERLHREVLGHLEHPLAFDERLLLHYAVSAAVALRLRDAGSEEHLRAYGVEPEADDDE